MAAIQRRRLGDLLIECRLITQQELQEALDKQKETGERLGELLIKMGLVTNDDIVWALGDQLNISYVHLSEDLVDPEVVRSFPPDQMKQHSFIPVFRIGNEITVVMADPLDIDALNTLETLTDEEINISIGAKHEIENYLETIFDTSRTDTTVVERPAATLPAADPRKLTTEAFRQLLDQLGPYGTYFHLVAGYLQEAGDLLRISTEAGGISIRLSRQLKTPMPPMQLDFEPDESHYFSLVRMTGNAEREASRGFAEGIVTRSSTQGPTKIRLVVTGSPAAWQITAECIRFPSETRADGLFAELESDEKARGDIESAWNTPGGLVPVASPSGLSSSLSIGLFTELPYHLDRQGAVMLSERYWDLPGHWLRLRLPAAPEHRVESLRRALRLKPRLLLIDSLREESGDRPLLSMAERAASMGMRIVIGMECQSLSTVRSLVGDNLFTRYTRFAAVRYLLPRNCPYCLVSAGNEELPSGLATAFGQENLSLQKGEGCELCNGMGVFGEAAVFFTAPVTAEGLQSVLIEAERRALKHLLSTGTVSPSAVKHSTRFPF